jgi:serine/threonine-protein kinase
LALRIKAALQDRYEISDVIGEGGAAVVFRARDLRHDRDVAVKVLRPQLAAALGADRFLQEIQITARLQHPHIVALFDSGSADGLVFYVMPLVTGESLRSLLRREARLSSEATVRIVREIAAALDYAHDQGIVHRDIKPENILLTSGQAMLADFGIAAAIERLVDRETLTEEGIVVGTPTYMSPEQGAGNLTVDRRSDVYSLGCVLFEMLAGEPPFTGRTPQAIIARHAHERLPSLAVVRPDVPAQLIAVSTKSLAKVPGDRYPTAGAMARALVEPAPISPPVSRKRLFAVVGVAIAAGLLFLWTLRSTPSLLDRNKVAVFPLEERSLSGDEGGAGASVGIMIGAALEHAGPLRPLDVRDRLTESQRTDPGTLTPAQRRVIAEAVGAGTYLAGIVQGHTDSITVTIRLFDVPGDSLIEQRSAGAPRRNIATHRVGIDAVKGLLPALVDPRVPIDLAPLRERAPAAIALFVQGEREYRGSRFANALGFYRRALAEDSSLAIAAIKGALAAYWQDHNLAAGLAQLALTRQALLPPRYADFARGLTAFAAGQADSAARFLAGAARAAPGWPEALMQQGEVYHHLLSPTHRAADSIAEQQFNAATAADSGFAPPLIHLSEIAARRGDVTAARRTIERFRAGGAPDDQLRHLTAMVDCVASRGRYDWPAMARANAVAVLRAGRALAVAGRQLTCAEGAFRALVATGPDSLEWGALLGLQSTLAAQGRTTDVIRLIDSVVKAGAYPVLMTAYVIDAWAGLPVDSQAAAVAAFGRERWGTDYRALSQSPPLQWLQWLFGSWHAKIGDRRTVETLARNLEDGSRAAARPDTRALADGLAAQARLLAHDTAGAIQALRRLPLPIPADSLTWSLASPLAAERLTLAELLLARGEYREALDVAAGFDHPEPLAFVPFVPRSLAIREQAARALGRRDEASEYGRRLALLSSKAP